MSSSDSSSDSSFFSSSAAAAPPAAAPPAAAAAGAAPPPTLVMRSSIFFLSKSLAKRPGQYGSISTPAALTMVAILSAYLFETQTQKRKKQVLEAVSARACVYAVEKVKRATSPQKTLSFGGFVVGPCLCLCVGVGSLCVTVIWWTYRDGNAVVVEDKGSISASEFWGGHLESILFLVL